MPILGGNMIEIYFTIRIVLLIAALVGALGYTVYRLWEWFR